MDVLFVFVAPIAAYKINVKFDWSSRFFSQNFNIWIKHGFSCINVSQAHWDFRDRGRHLVVIEEILNCQRTGMSCWCPLSCLLMCQYQCQYWSGQDGQCQNTSRQSMQTLPEQWCVCALTDHCAHQACLQLNMCRTFWTDGSTHNIDNKKPPGSWCDVTGGIDQITIIIQSMRR